jgi:branched-chain amino acid transport system permease protein
VVTLGFAEVVRLVIQEERWLTQGVQGLPGIPRLFHSLGVGQYAESPRSPCWRCAISPPSA